jgi:hypothetical protein
MIPALIGAGVGAGLGLIGRNNSPASAKSLNTASRGSAAKTTEGASTFAPNAAALPFYGFTAGQGNQLMQSPVPFFPGQTYVGPSLPTQFGTQLGMGSLAPTLAGAGLAAGAASPMQQAAGTAAGNFGFLSGAANVGANPYVQQMMQVNRDRIGEALQEDWLPSLEQGFMRTGSGALGSSRYGLAQGEASQNAARELGRANTELQLGAYGQGLSAQRSALGALGGLQQGFLAPSSAYGTAGQMMAGAGQQAAGIGQGVEGYQGQALQDAMARFGYQYSEPYQRLNLAAESAGMLAPLGTTHNVGAGNNSTSGMGAQPNPGYQSPFQAALSGGMAGYGLFG